MTRFVAGMTMVAVLLAGVSPTMAGDRYWNYTTRAAYPVQQYYSEPSPVKEERPLLKKLLIGGALIGIGFAAGRLTAPQAEPYYSGHHGGYSGYNLPQYSAHHHGHHQSRRW